MSMNSLYQLLCCKNKFVSKTRFTKAFKTRSERNFGYV